MNINFHYAAIKVLAHHAGLSEEDSQLIAYASQYTDDAVAYEPMKLNEKPEVDGIRYKEDEKEFDPICTAHKDLDYIQGVLKRRAQLLVYVCFHFIPSLEKTSSKPDFMKVVKDGPFAKELVLNFIESLKAAEKEDDKVKALIGLGIALHSYADTWSHQKFSGEWNDENNDISSLKILDKNGKFKNVGLFSTFLSYAMPNIGHAEAGTLPDRTEVTWKCKPPKRSVKGQSNCEEALEAAKTILGLLSDLTVKGKEAGKPWNELEGKLRECFMNPADKEAFEQHEKEHEWYKQFPELDFHYDEREWFRKALQPKGGFLDLIGSTLKLDPEDFKVLKGREYFHFHAAAKQQRDTVREAILERK